MEISSEELMDSKKFHAENAVMLGSTSHMQVQLIA